MMNNNTLPNLEKFEVWFITGSQSLYGRDALDAVEKHAQEIARELDVAAEIPVRVVVKPVPTTPENILEVFEQAGSALTCIGLIAWMHTFSPAKMWIRGLKALRKPLLHLHTQFNRDIPWDNIDMNFMNLNQSAHGDREFGHIMSRMRLNRKVVVGHWRDKSVVDRIAVWMRAAAAWHDWQGTRICRFGDNMRQVAVTEGDKVEAEIQFGYTVEGYGVGDLAAVVNSISDAAVTGLVNEYAERYKVVPVLRRGGDRHAALREAARIELGLRTFLQDGRFTGFTDTFEDLHGLEQLPGISVQRLMTEGYGFGGEGDWKTAALVRAMKVMGYGLPGGSSFMEDYTYHFNPDDPMVLGAHMLEVCESITEETPTCEVHPLGIGGKSDPVRLVFNGSAGSAVNASMVDMGNRFRLVVNTVTASKPTRDLPKLPVARVLWRPDPDIYTACAAWIYAGGGHHTGYSQSLTAEYLEDFAEIAGVEFVVIDRDTKLHSFKNMLRINDEVRR